MMTVSSSDGGAYISPTLLLRALGYALLVGGLNTVIWTRLLPAFAETSLFVVWTYYWWTLATTRSHLVSNSGDVARLIGHLAACEVGVEIVGWAAALDANRALGNLAVALLVIPCLSRLVNLTLLYGLLLSVTVVVSRLVLQYAHLPLSPALRALLSLSFGFLTTSLALIIVNVEERKERKMQGNDQCLGVWENDAASKSSLKKRRYSSFVSAKTKSTVHGVDMTTVIEAHGLLLSAVEQAPSELQEKLRGIAKLLASQAPTMDVTVQPKRPSILTSFSRMKAQEAEEDVEELDETASAMAYHQMHRKFTFTTVTDSMGLPKCEDQPTELRSRNNSLHLRRSGSRGSSLDTQKRPELSENMSTSAPSDLHVPSRLSTTAPISFIRKVGNLADTAKSSGYRNRSQSVDYSVLLSGSRLQAITELDTGSHNNNKHLGPPPNTERAVSVGPEEKESTKTKDEVGLEGMLTPPDAACKLLSTVNHWDFEILKLAELDDDRVLSYMAHKVFSISGLFNLFQFPDREFYLYFRALESGYRKSNPYHNRIHAADVVHACYYLMSGPVPGFADCLPPSPTTGDSDQDSGVSSNSTVQGSSEDSPKFSRSNTPVAESNTSALFDAFPPLEVLALYMAAAMHDYDHPGRTNAFLVESGHELAVLYNDHSVLENHHVASAWKLLTSDSRYNFLKQLEPAEFKRLRYLVVQLVLATDLKKHFDILALFNAKTDVSDACCIDWTSEQDRLLVLQMIVKLADISSPAKKYDIQIHWTTAISEEFYRQGDEEQERKMPVEMFMDRSKPQLAKLQVGFIRNLVAPLFNSYAAAGLLPGHLDESVNELEPGFGQEIVCDSQANNSPKFLSPVLLNLQSNFHYWESLVKEEQVKEWKEQRKAVIRQAAQIAEEWQKRFEEKRKKSISDNEHQLPSQLAGNGCAVDNQDSIVGSHVRSQNDGSSSSKDETDVPLLEQAQC